MRKLKQWILLLCVAVLACVAASCGDDKKATVSLSAYELSVQAGSAVELTVSVSDGSIATWSSSNTSVAYYEDGAVHGVSPGTAVLTVSVGSVSAECKVTVTSKPVVTPDNVIVTIGSTALELEANDSATLTAGVRVNGASSDKTVSWTSSDSCVTLTPNGNTVTVTAVSDGTANVRATYGDKYAECVVTVSTSLDVTVTVKGHIMGASELLKGGTVTLTNAENSNDKQEDLAVTDEGTVEAKLRPNATYKVAYTPTDANAQYCDGQFTLASDSATAEVTLEYVRFDLWVGWDGAQHDFSHVNDADPVIGNNAKTLNVITRDKYDDVSVSLWMKDGNSTYTNQADNNQPQGIFIKFEDGKYMFLRSVKRQSSGKHRVQWVPNFGLGDDNADPKWGGISVKSVIVGAWNDSCEGQYEDEFASADGLKVTLVRTGTKLSVFVNDLPVPAMEKTLDSAYGDDKVQVGFWDYDSAANATWKFDITDLTDYTTQDVALTVKGHKMGEIVNVEGSGTLTNLADDSNVVNNVALTGGTGMANLRVPAVYKLSVDGYNDGYIILTKGAAAAEVTLEYVRFAQYMANGWGDYNNNDQSNANNENPTITVRSGSFLDILSNDFYGNVSASLWVKSTQVTRDDKLHGIAFVFGDGKCVSYRVRYDNGTYTFSKVAGDVYGRTSVGGEINNLFKASETENKAVFDAINGADGYQMTLKKIGNTIALYLGGSDTQVPHSEFMLPEGYQGQNVRAGFYVANTVSNSDWKFDIKEIGALNPATQDVALTVKGHKAGEIVNVDGNATLTNAVDANDTHTATLTGGTGTAELHKVTTYKVTVDGYNYGYITVGENTTTAEVTLEYVRFAQYMANGWGDYNNNDQSNANNENPTITVRSGSFLDILSNDSYGNVSASLWIKSSQVTRADKLHGIALVFGDGKCVSYRVLYSGGVYTFSRYGKNADVYGRTSVGDGNDNLFKASATENKAIFDAIEGDGCQMTLRKIGNTIALYLGGSDVQVPLSEFTLPDGYKGQNVKAGFFAANTVANSVWKFDIKELDAPASATENVAVTVKGRKMGDVVNVEGSATLTNAADATDTHTVTLTGGTVTAELRKLATYKVTVAGYNDGYISVSENATAAEGTLEYVLFEKYLSWDDFNHIDFSKVNDENATIGIKTDEKWLNVLTKDAFGDVSVSLWVKGDNSKHGNRRHGIVLRFGDNKVVEYRFDYDSNTNSYKFLRFDGGSYEHTAIGGTKDNLFKASETENKAAFDAINSADGYRMTVKKVGNTVGLYVGGSDTPIDEFTLTGDYADQTVKVGFYCATAKVNSTWNFDITAI